MAAAVTFVFFGGPQGTQTALREALAPALDRHLGEITPELDELLSFIAFILPGIVATSWMVMTATNGSLAQGLLARFGVSWRPSPDLAALGLPIWIPVLLAFGAGATLFGGIARFVGVNVLIVLVTAAPWSGMETSVPLVPLVPLLPFVPSLPLFPAAPSFPLLPLQATKAARNVAPRM